MRRFLLVLSLCLALALSCFAQSSSDPNAPATRDDVQKYLDTMHSREMMHQMAEAMSKPMHQMIHDQYMRDKDRLPPDFEERMNSFMDDMFQKMPWDDMLDAMIPSYQKHFTKGDLAALTAFYSTPTGQKIIRELPAITAEAMQNMMPVMNKYMESMRDRIQTEVAQMKKNSAPKIPASLSDSN